MEHKISLPCVKRGYPDSLPHLVDTNLRIRGCSDSKRGDLEDYVHMHLEYGPSQRISDLVKKLKGRSSRKLQQEFPELKQRYWGKHFWSTGNITDEMVNEYLEHHRRPDDGNATNFIIEK